MRERMTSIGRSFLSGLVSVSMQPIQELVDCLFAVEAVARALGGADVADGLAPGDAFAHLIHKSFGVLGCSVRRVIQGGAVGTAPSYLLSPSNQNRMWS